MNRQWSPRKIGPAESFAIVVSCLAAAYILCGCRDGSSATDAVPSSSVNSEETAVFQATTDALQQKPNQNNPTKATPMTVVATPAIKLTPRVESGGLLENNQSGTPLVGGQAKTAPQLAVLPAEVAFGGTWVEPTMGVNLTLVDFPDPCDVGDINVARSDQAPRIILLVGQSVPPQAMVSVTLYSINRVQRVLRRVYSWTVRADERGEFDAKFDFDSIVPEVNGEELGTIAFFVTTNTGDGSGVCYIGPSIVVLPSAPSQEIQPGLVPTSELTPTLEPTSTEPTSIEPTLTPESVPTSELTPTLEPTSTEPTSIEPTLTAESVPTSAPTPTLEPTSTEPTSIEPTLTPEPVPTSEPTPTLEPTSMPEPVPTSEPTLESL